MKAALLGAGEPHFSAHLNTLQVLPEVETIYIWGEDQKALDDLRGEAKVEGLFSDVDDLLAQQDIFFAIASVAGDDKMAIHGRLLEAGIHLMAEKPMATCRSPKVRGRSRIRSTTPATARLPRPMPSR